MGLSLLKFTSYIPEVKLLAESRGIMGPEEIVAYGANACIKKEDPITLYEKHISEKRDIDEFIDRVLNITIKSGHLSVLDQVSFTFILRNIPRIATLFMVTPVFLSHLQQSMRSVEPYGYYTPDELNDVGLLDEYKCIMNDSLKFYYKLVNSGVPKEDARYVIPLNTVTNIQTSGNGRAFTHLHLMSKDEGIPSITRRIIDDIWGILTSKFPKLFMDRETNRVRHRYYPSPQLFSKRLNWIYNDEFRETINAKLVSHHEPIKATEEDIKNALVNGDEYILNILKYMEYGFLIKVSLTTLHQVLRQRTWWHVVEPIYHAINKRLEYVVPPEIKRRGLESSFCKQVERQYYFYHKCMDRGMDMSNAVGVIAHAHTIYDFIKVDGWNVVGALPLRRCLRAQWEIRYIANIINNYISRINPELSQYSSPSCVVFGICPEKYPCDQKEIFLSREPIVRRE